jgi:thymidylate synthase (FAD)
MASLELFEKTFNNKINPSNFTRRELEMILAPHTVSVSKEGASRLFTHRICETKDSYTQQSLRYVKLTEGSGFYLPENLPKGLEKEFLETTEFLFRTYDYISQRKSEYANTAGRPNKDWYELGVPPEDARGMLPLSTNSNIFVTIPGDKLPSFIEYLVESGYTEANTIAREFADLVFENADEFIDSLEVSEDSLDVGYRFNREVFDNFDKVKFLWDINGSRDRAGLGAATSAKRETPSEYLNKLYDKKSEEEVSESLGGIAKRTIDKRHISVAEHARFSMGLTMSLAAYHQYERHRLPSNLREPFEEIPIDRNVVVPDSVLENAKAYDLFMGGIERAKQTREKLMDFDPKIASYMLTNSDRLKVISNMNPTMFSHIFQERYCNNAQTEIRILVRDMRDEITQYLDKKLFYQLGPKCVFGPCPEKDYTCGKQKEMREEFRKQK